MKSFGVLEQLAAFANAFRTARNILNFIHAHFIQKPAPAFWNAVSPAAHFIQKPVPTFWNAVFPAAHFTQKPVPTFWNAVSPSSAFYPKTGSHFLECAVSHLHFARWFLNIHNETRFRSRLSQRKEASPYQGLMRLPDGNL
ncbi:MULTISPECIES: hypothetical protein [Ochrobactrum]|uniref:Uncharacterized protein n=1 Tax=Ochrobactrum chromiisoli TaxID=2993941 RepID=A0ABT3QI81_9HYPH|nr:hypothetical protein [Ochrobactrum chromiisoli]MCX2695315.1 hypothetical protein [Ochrobactrum chromiisoli]